MENGLRQRSGLTGTAKGPPPAQPPGGSSSECIVLMEISPKIGIVSEQSRGRNDAVLSAKRPETSPSRSCLLDQGAGSFPFVGALRDGESVSSRDGDHRVEGSEGLGIIGSLELEP